MNARLTVLALVIGCFVMGFGADVSAQVTTKPAPAGGPKEGIKVHGDWVIEVRNPDGTLATRREFKNALATANGGLLPGVLSREFSLGAWVVTLGSGGGNPPCGTDCRIHEAGSNVTGPGVFHTLTLATSSGQFVLNGTATAASNSQIATVNTSNRRCQGGVVPSLECPGDSGQLFTFAFFPSPIPVVAGQIIQVTVTISFS